MSQEHAFLFGEGKSGGRIEFTKEQHEVLGKGCWRGKNAIKSVEDNFVHFRNCPYKSPSVSHMSMNLETLWIGFGRA